MKTEWDNPAFLPPGFEDAFAAEWKSPSNIALVKYWGKKEGQIPANPSLSFTLSECVTRTQIWISDKATESKIQVFYDGKLKPEFGQKVQALADKMKKAFPVLKNKAIAINTLNTFPHSSGIASSASGMSALALCICDYLQVQGKINKKDFFQTASFWSRIGSGSACRSLYGGYNAWGASYTLRSGSDEFAVQIEDIHPDLQTLCDSILIVDDGRKAMNSTAGHGLMDGHPYAPVRYDRANKNFGKMLMLLKNGDMNGIGEIMEAEALELHALMMTSANPFWLMKGGTLKILEEIRDFRKQNKLPVYFTLDAGANVHCIYPQSIENQVEEFINNQLKQHCVNGQYIRDRIGKGPEKLSHD